MREYAEDTAFRSLVSSTTTFSARRRTLFLFHTDDSLPSPLHLVDNKGTIWDDLAERLEKVDPQKIAVNVSWELVPDQDRRAPVSCVRQSSRLPRKGFPGRIFPSPLSPGLDLGGLWCRSSAPR